MVSGLSTPTFRPKVLVLAEACNPEWASVPLVGWSMYEALRDVADVHLVTQVRNREALERAGLVHGRDFTAIDSELVAKAIWKLAGILRMGENKGWTVVQALSSISYAYFEHLVWRQFGGAIKTKTYDIVHRITPLSPSNPSVIASKLCKAGQVFVIGPLNGGLPWPPGFDAERRREREWLSHFRSAYRLLPGYKATLRANAIIVGSRFTGSEIPLREQSRVIYVPENGIDPARFWRVAAPQDGPLRACFVGRLVPLKGTDMLLEAASPLLQAGKMTLDFIGDGPVADDLKASARAHGIEHAVRFHGWLPHQNVQDVLAKADVFTFLSMKEFGGGAVLEAMALGVAPLVVDYGGPGELIDGQTGFKVPLGSRSAIIEQVRALLSELADNPSRVAAAGEKARQRVQSHFTWGVKARQVLDVYKFALGMTQKPEPFAFPSPSSRETISSI